MLMSVTCKVNGARSRLSADLNMSIKLLEMMARRRVVDWYGKVLSHIRR